MNLCNIASVSLAALLYVYLIIQIRKGAVEQNLATWTSWGLLDVVAGISLFAQHGNWYLLAIYVAGSTTVSIFIFRSAKFKLEWVEKVCIALVIISIVLWKISGPWYATLFSTLGVSVATYPQIRDAFLEPRKSPLDVYCGFIVVNALSTAGGKSWTMEERFYPAVCTGLCTLIVLFTLRRYFAKEPRDA